MCKIIMLSLHKNMFAQTFYFLPLLYLISSLSEDEFIVVSTTRRSSEPLSNSDLIDEKINSIKQRVDTLESINAQNKISKRINEIEDRLRVLESKNRQSTTDEIINKIQPRFEGFASKTDLGTIRKEINRMHHKLDILESSATQMPQKLNTTTSTSSPTSYDNNTVYLKNCKEVQQRGHSVSKIYQIRPEFSSKTIEVLCDMERRGGGWTYILNRFDGSQDFNLNWNEYKVGFGSLLGEFWLGLDNIYYLTGSEVNELLVELVDWDGKVVYAHYDTFSIGNEIQGYPLNILGKYEGTAGDSFRFNEKMKFSTLDKDQDTDIKNCARTYGGGWWFKACMYCFLTGKYHTENVSNITDFTGIWWFYFRGDHYSLKQARMMVKPKRIS